MAIVIREKFEASEVFYLEAVSTGVALNKWSYIRNFVNSPAMSPAARTSMYDKVAFRHVSKERSKEMEEKMRSFMAQTLGKGYEVSYSKLIQRNTVPFERETTARQSSTDVNTDDDGRKSMDQIVRVQRVPQSVRLSTPSQPMIH